MKELKPPLGVIPERIQADQRRDKLRGAIYRYLQGDLKVPMEWVTEYNELIRINE